MAFVGPVFHQMVVAGPFCLEIDPLEHNHTGSRGEPHTRLKERNQHVNS